MAAVARDVGELAPDAHFFNYGNPMTANVAAMSRFHPVVGLCHGLGHVHRDLAAIIGAPYEETSILYCGLNHLTWITDFRWKGRDAFGLLRERIAEEKAAGIDEGELGDIFNQGARWTHNPFSFELFEAYDAYPSASDRHVASWSASRARAPTTGGRSAWTRSRCRRSSPGARSATSGCGARPRASRSSTPRSSTARLGPPGGAHRHPALDDVRPAADLLRANAPNTGYVPNLPTGAVLEIPGVVTGLGLRPVSVPDFPAPLAGIVARRGAFVDVTIEAALRGDRDLAVEAMLLDGAVTDPDTARALVDRYLAGQAEDLPQFATPVAA